MVARARYDDLLKELMEAHRDAQRARLDAIDTGVRLVAHQAEVKNAELNDVRHRFIPRETFEQHIQAQAAKNRTLLLAMGAMGLTIVGLVLQVVGR